MAQAKTENHGEAFESLKAWAVKKPRMAYSVKCAIFLTIVTSDSTSFRVGKRKVIALTIKPDWRFESSAGAELKIKMIIVKRIDGYQVLKNLPNVFNSISKL